MDKPFVSKDPVIEDYWRSVILFGKNVASYKFALAKALLELNPHSGQLIKLHELAEPFARHVAEHLKSAKQGQFAGGKFLEACRAFGQGQLNHDRLIDQTVRFGFNNVIDAFHIVGSEEIPQRFFIDERKAASGIRITDEFSRLAEGAQIRDLPMEVEARWRLVETAWELRISRGLLLVDHDSLSETLIAVSSDRKRRTVTSSRDALNGYQKGYCFYCYTPIHLEIASQLPDVDHFFPHKLKQTDFGKNVDGVWNLVLACRGCNRGSRGKSDRVPSEKLLLRLYNRNEYLIQSHHPLTETLRKQTGAEEPQRRAFLSDCHTKARALLIHQWEPA